jgi:uncharacterized protein (TIGR02147 family)
MKSMNPMSGSQELIQNALREQYVRAQLATPGVSIRTFARRAGISPTTATMILRGKRSMSVQLLEKVAARLGLDGETRARIFPELRERIAEEQLKKLGRLPKTPAETHHLTERELAAYLNPHGGTLLHLITLKDCPAMPDAISFLSERTGMDNEATKLLLDTLMGAGLIRLNTRKRLQRTHYRISSSGERMRTLKDQALRAQIDRGIHALLTLSPHERDITGGTFVFDRKKLPLLRELIQKFYTDVEKFLDSAEYEKNLQEEDVFRMNIQVFPLTLATPKRREQRGYES